MGINKIIQGGADEAVRDILTAQFWGWVALAYVDSENCIAALVKASKPHHFQQRRCRRFWHRALLQTMQVKNDCELRGENKLFEALVLSGN